MPRSWPGRWVCPPWSASARPCSASPKARSCSSMVRTGTAQVDPPADVLRDASERRERAARRRAVARERAHEPGVTRDGTRIEVFANLGSVKEAARAVELGAEGVGLLRTEFLFLDRAELPDEEEQAETLREIARALRRPSPRRPHARCRGGQAAAGAAHAARGQPVPRRARPAPHARAPGAARDPIRARSSAWPPSTP